MKVYCKNCKFNEDHGFNGVCFRDVDETKYIPNEYFNLDYQSFPNLFYVFYHGIFYYKNSL